VLDFIRHLVYRTGMYVDPFIQPMPAALRAPRRLTVATGVVDEGRGWHVSCETTGPYVVRMHPHNRTQVRVSYCFFQGKEQGYRCWLGLLTGTRLTLGEWNYHHPERLLPDPENYSLKDFILQPVWNNEPGRNANANIDV
jgi:hypothetical protein